MPEPALDEASCGPCIPVNIAYMRLCVFGFQSGLVPHFISRRTLLLLNGRFTWLAHGMEAVHCVAVSASVFPQ